MKDKVRMHNKQEKPC